ncbi:hypothetical protein BHM03_00043630 [Ensete ventricosum]|nr:hypothetical protein BHM03_00043630 [Ensete ventricosum]
MPLGRRHNKEYPNRHQLEGSNPTIGDHVQREFVKSKEEIGESPQGGFSFVPEIQDKPIPDNFRLSALEHYDGSTDLSEHIVTFRAHMALYDTSDSLMCRAFPMTLRGPARMCYSRLRPSSISSFDSLAKEFELNFMASSRPRPIVASLLGLAQGSDEPLAQFVDRFAAEVRGMPDAHPSLAIQAFLIGLRPSRFFWSLIERPPSTIPEMMHRINQYVATKMLVAEKREDQKRSRNDHPRGQPSGAPRRRDRPECPRPSLSRSHSTQLGRRFSSKSETKGSSGPPTRSGQRLEGVIREVVETPLDPKNPTRTIKVGSVLPEEQRVQLVEFLGKNADIFA